MLTWRGSRRIGGPRDGNCPKRVRLGDARAALGRKVGLTDEDIAVIDRTRDKTPAKPIILTSALLKAPAHRST